MQRPPLAPAIPLLLLFGLLFICVILVVLVATTTIEFISDPHTSRAQKKYIREGGSYPAIHHLFYNYN